MFTRTLLPIFALGALGSTAIQITEPTSSDKWDLNKAQEIKWSSVNTDPTTFTIYLELANSTSSPAAQDLVASEVTTSNGEFSYTPKDLPGGQGYRVNFVADNGGILAQSDYFAVSSAGQINAGIAGVLVVALGAVAYMV